VYHGTQGRVVHADYAMDYGAWYKPVVHCVIGVDYAALRAVYVYSALSVDDNANEIIECDKWVWVSSEARSYTCIKQYAQDAAERRNMREL
jgi:hypothetical protein